MKRKAVLGLLIVWIWGNHSVERFAQAQGERSVITIKAGRLIDGTGAPAIDNAVILVTGEKITDVGPASRVQVPSGANLIDLSRNTVMPGLIDGHAHLSTRADTGGLDGTLKRLTEPDAQQMSYVPWNIRLQLLSGATTQYGAGDVHSIDVYTQQAVQKGLLPGPRTYPSGVWISTTAGLGPPESLQINGPWEMRRMVRKNYEAGAHHIKLTVIDSPLGGPQRGKKFGHGASNFTKEEIEAVVDEAHRLGIRVTAHASGESARLALEAGVDSIQHGEALTEELAALFRKKNVGFVNTYTVSYGRFIENEWTFLDTQAKNIREWVDRCRQAIKRIRDSDAQRDREVRARWRELKMAKDRGVAVIVGTDHMPGLLPLEIENLVDSGFTPLEAITAATGGSAKVLGIADEVGTLQKGKYADIIAVAGRPDQNIQDLTQIQFIMVGGRDFSSLSFR